MNHQAADLRSLRHLLVERMGSAPTVLATMYGQMIAVMDNHLGLQRAGGGRRDLAFKRKTTVRSLHRHVSKVITNLYGVNVLSR